MLTFAGSSSAKLCNEETEKIGPSSTLHPKGPHYQAPDTGATGTTNGAVRRDSACNLYLWISNVSGFSWLEESSVECLPNLSALLTGAWARCFMLEEPRVFSLYNSSGTPLRRKKVRDFPNIEKMVGVQMAWVMSY